MYYLVYSLLYLLSLLPFRVLYGISDVAVFILEYVLHYRKNVIDHNLRIAFPEKSDKEIIQIKRAFYRHFSDNFIETIKLLSITPRTLRRRFHCVNPEVMVQLHEEHKSVNVLLAHFFNWEYANQAYQITIPQDLAVVYMPIKNKIVNRLFHKMRSRFGSHLIAATNFSKEFQPFRAKEHVLILVGDQNPGNINAAYWAPFFGKMAPFVKGPEKGARFSNTAVVFCQILPVKRGYYQSKLFLITKAARETENGQITKEMIRLTEDTIKQYPANYLWSHRRFRHEFDKEKHQRLVI